MSLETILDGARKAKLQLLSDGHKVEAEAIRRLLASRMSSRTLNQVLHTDLARTRAILRRAHDAMSRRDPDGISEADWEAIIADAAKELGGGNG